ncbi:energy-coupled thiamine transporter ThiT [Peribacillus sp. SCS-155]|uniref:energy-coupled thiamine transporter ThiT n=1 Tax=Peribacillus sedimenti TaxID=3115297 RepID=UPI0039066A09
MKNKTLFMVEVAVFAALALLLDWVSGVVFSRIWPQGGSVSIAMVPVFLMAYRWGLKGGLLTGFLLGMLQMVLTYAQVVHPAQGFLEYFLAFTLVGAAGLFTNSVNGNLEVGKRTKAYTYAVLGIFIGSFLRFLCHFAAGIIFWGSYAPEGQPVALYSLIYNGTYMLASFILSAIVVVMLYSAAAKVLLRKSYQS